MHAAAKDRATAVPLTAPTCHSVDSVAATVLLPFTAAACR